MQREPAAFVEVHPDDAAEAGMAAGQLAELSSRRGTLRLPVRLNPGLSRGVVFVPFHWGDQYGEQTAANYLTISAIGRVAKQPEYKDSRRPAGPGPRLRRRSSPPSPAPRGATGRTRRSSSRRPARPRLETTSTSK